jgi:RNA polymerase sigma-70 factor (ECF subfamily)
MQRTTPHKALQEREARLQALLLQGLEGDETTYRQFLTLLGAHLRSFLRRRLQTPDVEDLLQETLLAVHNARHTYRADQPLTVWVQAIARYKLMDHFRAHARRDALNDPLDDEAMLLADEDNQAEQAKRDLTRLMEQLPDKQRLPILYVKLQGLSVSETATLTGLSVSAVKVGVHRGLKALATLIRGADENR